MALFLEQKPLFMTVNRSKWDKRLSNTRLHQKKSIALSFHGCLSLAFFCYSFWVDVRKCKNYVFMCFERTPTSSPPQFFFFFLVTFLKNIQSSQFWKHHLNLIGYFADTFFLKLAQGSKIFDSLKQLILTETPVCFFFSQNECDYGNMQIRQRI